MKWEFLIWKCSRNCIALSTSAFVGFLAICWTFGLKSSATWTYFTALPSPKSAGTGIFEVTSPLSWDIDSNGVFVDWLCTIRVLSIRLLWIVFVAAIMDPFVDEAVPSNDFEVAEVAAEGIELTGFCWNDFVGSPIILIFSALEPISAVLSVKSMFVRSGAVFRRARCRCPWFDRKLVVICEWNGGGVMPPLCRLGADKVDIWEILWASLLLFGIR